MFLALPIGSARSHRVKRSGIVFRRRSFRRSLAGVIVVLAAVAVARSTALASTCGSYVISNGSLGVDSGGSAMNPMTHDGMVDHQRSVGSPHSPHVPTPCELGFCHGPNHVPAAPPIPNVRPLENLLFHFDSAAERDGVQWRYITGSAWPRPGFQLQLDRPPKSLQI
jgi:hypothetical protein